MNSINTSDKQNLRKGFVKKELLLEDEEIKFVFSVEINKSLEDQSIDIKPNELKDTKKRLIN